jgi:uncharacterized protein
MDPFHIMAKPHGPICNLNCTYCYYLEKENLYAAKGRDYRMSDSVLESYIRQYIQAQPAEHVSFAWQGGEPTLLGIPFFERVLELQKKYAGDKTIDNAFQTNGTLLDDAWGEFLARNKFLIGLSVDGPVEIHDAYRVDKGGQPTFARVMRGLDVLKKHGVEFNTLTVINRLNSYSPREVYRFLKGIGSKYLQFIPVVEQMAAQPDPNGLVLLKPYARQETSVSEWSVEPLQFGKFLSGVFDEWVLSDVGRVFVQVFDVALEGGASTESLRLRATMRQGVSSGAQRRPLFVRPLCLSRKQAWQHHGKGDVWFGELTAADTLRKCEVERIALRLPEVRCSICVQWRVPQAPLQHDRIGRIRPQLSLRRV